MQLTFMYNIVLLYMLIFLVADCVCGGHIISSWGGHIISSCGGSTLGLMGRFHPAPHRLDRDALYEDPCGGLGVQDEATRVMEDSIPTDDKPTIYDL